MQKKRERKTKKTPPRGQYDVSEGRRGQKNEGEVKAQEGAVEV